MCEQKPYAVYRVECEHSLKLMFGKRTLILPHPYTTLSLQPLNTET